MTNAEVAEIEQRIARGETRQYTDPHDMILPPPADPYTQPRAAMANSELGARDGQNARGIEEQFVDPRDYNLILQNAGSEAPLGIQIAAECMAMAPPDEEDDIFGSKAVQQVLANWETPTHEAANATTLPKTSYPVFQVRDEGEDEDEDDVDFFGGDDEAAYDVCADIPPSLEGLDAMRDFRFMLAEQAYY